MQSLQAPAHVAPGGARIIAAASDPNPLAALLREVNETMLGRALTFESRIGTNLTLEVSGRRVLRLTAASGLAGAESCLSEPALEDAHKDDLIKLLQALAVPNQELRVTTTPIDREREGVSVGLPVALLADLLLVDLNPLAATEFTALEAMPTTAPSPKVAPEARLFAVPDPPPVAVRPPATAPVAPEAATYKTASADFLGRFARGTGPVLMAWLITGGDEDGTTEGPDEMVSHLQGFLDDEAEAVSHQLDQISTAPDGPICIVLGATLVEGHSVLCARSGEGVLLGVIEGDGTQTLMQAWSAAFA
ncbi:hypothetical protein [Tabrizicola sp.]|uniref:hypothetical protein n=1 Tax=Tabrizicola sp. TaxID=2005166 RepID=UPI00260555D1|nr:hypothetical protein [Tabrizicola sp.]MDM7931580.1 hypothetical protein [Tabrizicola sp.]